MNDVRPVVDSTRDQATTLMANRGDHCRKVVEPKISELNHRFAAICHRIKTGKVGRSAPRWKLVLSDLLRRLRSTLKGAHTPHSKVFKRKMKAKMYLRKLCSWISQESLFSSLSLLPHSFLSRSCFYLLLRFFPLCTALLELHSALVYLCISRCHLQQSNLLHAAVLQQPPQEKHKRHLCKESALIFFGQI